MFHWNFHILYKFQKLWSEENMDGLHYMLPAEVLLRIRIPWLQESYWHISLHDLFICHDFNSSCMPVCIPVGMQNIYLYMYIELGGNAGHLCLLLITVFKHSHLLTDYTGLPLCLCYRLHVNANTFTGNLGICP